MMEKKVYYYIPGILHLEPVEVVDESLAHQSLSQVDSGVVSHQPLYLQTDKPLHLCSYLTCLLYSKKPSRNRKFVANFHLKRKILLIACPTILKFRTHFKNNKILSLKFPSTQ